MPLTAGATATWRAPQGERGRYKHGFRVYDDRTVDWRGYQALEIAVEAEPGREVAVETTILAPAGLSADERTVSKTTLTGAKVLRLPWSSFDHPQARTSFLKFVQGLDLAARYTDGRPGAIRFTSAAVVKGSAVSLESPVLGRSAPAGGSVTYQLTVGNSSTSERAITLDFESPGWASLRPVVEPATLRLQPNETRACTVTVAVPAGLPPGAHEKQVIRATPDGDAALASRLTFITGCQVPSPYILHTPTRWDEVREKVKRYPWASDSLAGIVKRANAWKVPEVARPPGNDPDDTMGPFLFATANEHELMSCGVSWQLTHDKSHAEKVALFLRRLSDPATGYVKTLRGCNQGQVQEGHFFQHLAMAYDMVRDSGVFSVDDHARIETAFRLFMESMDRLNDAGSINNWNVSQVTGAFYCALALQDLSAAERFFSGPNGIVEQLAKGTMDDGWWYECSIGYNTWVASEFTQAALAYEPWGVNFRDMRVPANLSGQVLLVPELNGGSPFATDDPEQRAKPFGMDPAIYGPNRRPWREIRQMWNGLLPFLDWRGVMFGVNDSTESSVVASRGGVDPSAYELAYYVYRDPAYASVVKRGTTRDLLYGVPELPAETPEPFRESAAADNVGLAMLRSRTADRPVSDQIQATLHYGTHGWAHGHYDRTNLLSLMRYGRSFYNPEMAWHGYEPFMYKFYVQTSVSKNMVVVDRKMQKAAPGERLLFHTGPMMQAAAVETVTPWSNPPYGGMVYDYVPVKDFAGKTWREGRSVPIPENAPGYGALTGYTEPIRQRRLMVVTDDYVLLADDTAGTAAHEYESLFQMKGFLGLDAASKKFLRHDGQWDTNPVGSAQFVTDCDRYEVTAPAVARFEMKFGPGADNEGTRALCSEDGVLKLDVHSLWPAKQEIMIGSVPEDHGLGQRLFYNVRGDGRTLAEGKFGAWTLGKGDVDVAVEGVKTLELETRVELKKRPTLFWGSARVVTKDGREIPLSDLPVEAENVVLVEHPNTDYDGGPVKIQGEPQPFSTPAQPQEESQPAIVKVDLSKVEAVRFVASVGSDFPPGPEAQRRKTMAVKAATAPTARFLSIIEPYEDQPVVKSAAAVSADKIRVELADGRVQELTLHDLSGKLSVDLVETKDGRELRRESTSR
ncbi:hypothetical protein llg_28670 [Luteolibacter sp. LG18]|nr:hypothetical protein llg_28670 [Luteolibacter sp. LG18]